MNHLSIAKVVVKKLSLCLSGLVFLVSTLRWVGNKDISQYRNLNNHTSSQEPREMVDDHPSQHLIFNKVKEISQSKSRHQDWILSNPDKYYQPGNCSEAYSKNYRRHNQIAQYYYSPIKNEPGMQKLLRLLVENGHDVFEWVNAVVVLTDYHLPVAQVRDKMIKAGFSEDEVTHLSGDVRNKQLRRKEWIVSEFKRWTQIKSETLILEILYLDFPLDTAQATMLGRSKLKPGDRFLTDEDWQ